MTPAIAHPLRADWRDCVALNQWYESDIDALMKRTARRPVPAGRIERCAALQFGVWTSVLSVGLMELAANRLAATLLAVAITLRLDGDHAFGRVPDSRHPGRSPQR
jgi:hypothetical protein